MNMRDYFIEDYKRNMEGSSRGNKWDARQLTSMLACNMMSYELNKNRIEAAKKTARGYEEFVKYFDEVNA